ncbi:hypothetical protein NY78_1313 [Desulfovibrio sp. TomC]|nr:hypothetical protein NY78_1313 [Desulfovibrio sp. TomC]
MPDRPPTNHAGQLRHNPRLQASHRREAALNAANSVREPALP